MTNKWKDFRLTELDASDADKSDVGIPKPPKQPPSIPAPHKKNEFGEMLAQCLNSDNKHGNTPR